MKEGVGMLKTCEQGWEANIRPTIKKTTSI